MDNRQYKYMQLKPRTVCIKTSVGTPPHWLDYSPAQTHHCHDRGTERSDWLYRLYRDSMQSNTRTVKMRYKNLSDAFLKINNTSHQNNKTLIHEHFARRIDVYFIFKKIKNYHLPITRKYRIILHFMNIRHLQNQY
jgi:hypothetical protein